MSGAAHGASDVIDVMEWEVASPSARGTLRNHKNRIVRATAARTAGEEIRRSEQPQDRNLNKLDSINTEVQIQFRELRDQVAAEIAKEIAKEMAKMTAQFTKELSLVREQLTQAQYKLEDTRL
ncbi:hypothetical protein VTI28DRAFT_5109 [Corynascus sepedonium]